jgi:nondiscriminating aspartyl-tRNA synthetase
VDSVERIYSSALAEHVGERVLLAGWVHVRRELGSVSFLVVRDCARLAQVVVDGPLELLPESVVEVEAVVVAAEQAPGGVELRAPLVSVLAEPVKRPPVELRRPELKETLPTILDHAPLALRHPRLRARFEIAAASLHGFRAALDRLGFTEISTPKIVGSQL